MDYNLNDGDMEEEIKQKDNKWPKTFKILIILFICICLALAAALITFILLYINKSTDKQKEEQKSKSDDKKNIYLLTVYKNLAYDVNGIIENTFKKNGDNYNESMGEINNGTDYKKNDRNIYDLYIPQYALDRKNETNGIILWIHGGAWIEGTKDGMDIFCKLYSQQGYISATVGYTLLNSKDKVFNIFKMLDEITSCIKAIKKYLINLGFSGDKLKLVIAGYSAGGHLTLLYSYLIKKVNIIPISFLINYAGPIGLYPKYFYKLNSTNDTLENIEQVQIIEQAMKDGKIVPIFQEIMSLHFMNAFLGNKYSSDEISKMVDKNGKIIEENEKYKEMLKVVKFSFVTEIEDYNRIPTICIYGGIDDVVGVTVYAYLKQKADKDGRKLNFIYSRSEGHLLILPSTPDGSQKIKEANSLIMKYLKKYFGY